MAKDILRLVEDIKLGNIDVENLDSFTRRSLTYALLEEMVFTHAQIAELVGFSRTHVSKLNAQRKESYIPILNSIDLKAVIANHVQASEHVKTKLAQGGDWLGVWRVHRELLQDLQSLGYLKKMPDELKITLEDRAKAWQDMFGINLSKETQIVNSN